jgi:DnaJ-class molecular chaperone
MAAGFDDGPGGVVEVGVFAVGEVAYVGTPFVGREVVEGAEAFDDFPGAGREGGDDVGDLFGGLRVCGDQGSGEEGGEKDSGDATQRGDDSQVQLLWVLSGFVSGYFERRDLPVKANRGSLTDFACRSMAKA